MTHYIPAFTFRDRHLQQAACGSMVRAHDHSVQPTCTACALYLVHIADEDEATARALEAEYPEFAGKLATR